jgi:DNA-binding NtrC family response regulator
VIERAVVICEGPDVRIEHLPADVGAWLEDNAAISFEEEVRAFKRRVIQRALLQTGNNKLQAARSLKIARSSLHRLIDELEIGIPDAPEESADLNPPTDPTGPGTQPKPGSSVISFRRNMA